MLTEKITEMNRKAINQFIQKHWYSTEMAVRGKLIDMTSLDGFFISDHSVVVGLITYLIHEHECEILSLDSTCENKGIGTELLKSVIDVARASKCGTVKLITTNDNINAMRFYQKRGFDMSHIYHNAVEISRKLKPSIPLTGDFGIPIKHEIEFVFYLSGEKATRISSD